MVTHSFSLIAEKNSALSSRPIHNASLARCNRSLSRTKPCKTAPPFMANDDIINQNGIPEWIYYGLFG